MALGSLSKSATLTTFHICEIAVAIFGLLLLIGWIGEIAKSDRWKAYHRAFVIMAIVGVAGEWIADIGIFMLSEHLQTLSAAAPILTSDQQEYIAIHLRQFAGEAIDVLAYQAAPPASWFIANQIAGALGEKDGAHWKVRFGLVIENNRTFNSMLVETTKQAGAKDKDAAQALASVLSDIHVHVFGPSEVPPNLDMRAYFTGPRRDVIESAPIHLTVGTIPPL